MRALLNTVLSQSIAIVVKVTKRDQAEGRYFRYAGLRPSFGLYSLTLYQINGMRHPLPEPTHCSSPTSRTTHERSKSHCKRQNLKINYKFIKVE